MKYAITTNSAKKKMLLARAGKQVLPAITAMVFGSGGVDADGNVLEPKEEQEQLTQEIYRKNIDKVEIVSDTQVRYYCTLEENELAGKKSVKLPLQMPRGI